MLPWELCLKNAGGREIDSPLDRVEGELIKEMTLTWTLKFASG